jgi:hypothetical protein
VLDTKSPKYLEMAQGHISLSRPRPRPGVGRGGDLLPRPRLGSSEDVTPPEAEA